MGSVLGSFGAFQGNIWSVAPFIPVGNLQKNTKKLFLTRIPAKYLKSYIFWTGSSRRFRKGRTLVWASQLHLGCLQHHCDHMPKLPYLVCGAKSTNMTNMLKLGHGGSHETLPPRDQQDGSSACRKVDTVLLKAFCTGAPLLPPVV